MRSLRTVPIFLTLLALLCLTVTASQRGKTQRVRFARGRTTAVLKGAVVRGTNDRYILGARQGQTMIVHITSHEKNAVFTILDPQATALPGTDEGLDATDWSGSCRIPATTQSGFRPRAETPVTRSK